ncbi:MAG: hypothetical protein FWC95_03970 [Defluviitaleaceae bacterium]|nr:hypothetical protein [Defluviitaleaceae bacterium]
MTKKLIPILLICLFFFSSCATRVIGDIDEETAERIRFWTADVEQFRSHVLRWHPKFVHEDLVGLPRNIEQGIALDHHLNKLLKNIINLTDFEVLAELQRAAAILQDGHFIFGGFPFQNNFMHSLMNNRYPLVFKWLYDGFYLAMADEDFNGVLNHKLLAINNIPIEDVFSAFIGFMSVENIYGAKSQFALHVNAPGLLDAIGVKDSTDTVFGFCVGNGSDTLNISIPKSYIIAMDGWWGVNWIANWYSFGLVDNRIEGELPVMFRNHETANWHIFFEGDGLLYIRIHESMRFGNDFKYTFDNAVRLTESRMMRATIIDLRGNPGGDKEAYLPYFRILAENTPPGSLFVFMDEGVYSAALLSAGYLYTLGAVLVGRPSGQLTDFYAFVGTSARPQWWATLRFSRYEIAVPNQFFTLRPLGINPPDLTLRPHITIDFTIEDWINNRDPLLEYVLGRIN